MEHFLNGNLRILLNTVLQEAINWFMEENWFSIIQLSKVFGPLTRVVSTLAEEEKHKLMSEVERNQLASHWREGMRLHEAFTPVYLR